MRQLTQGILALALIGLIGGGIALAGNELRLRAQLRAEPSAGDISGAAKYRVRDNGRVRFQLEVEGFRPGTTLDVVVDGVKVGAVTIDSLGVGEIDFDTNIEAGDDEGEPFPSNFPSLEEGDMVQVGQLRGAFQRKK
jgi:hypothetical protein